MKKEIRIVKGRDCWMADWVGDEEIRGLFGQTLLPTAYTLGMPIDEVIRKIQELNPGYLVTI